MSLERIDPETLAAFLDGRLDPAERDRVLRIIAEHPDEYEVFADAAAVVGELRGEAAHPDPADLVAPTGSTTRARWRLAIPIALAAGVVGLVLLPQLRGPELASSDRLAGWVGTVAPPGSGSLAARLGAGWDQPGWSVTRGAADGVADPARAFRLGARVTDVEVASRAADSSGLRLVGEDLVRLVEPIEGGAATAARYRRMAELGPVSPAERRDAAAGLRALVGESPWFDLGAWAEAGRLAGAVGSEGYFTAGRAALAAIGRRLEELPEAERREVLPLVRELVDRLGAGAGPAVATEARGLVERIVVAAGR